MAPNRWMVVIPLSIVSLTNLLYSGELILTSDKYEFREESTSKLYMRETWLRISFRGVLPSREKKVSVIKARY